VGRVYTNTDSTQNDGEEKDGEVYVLGNLLVVPHETGVDVLGLSEGGLAADQVLETNNDLTTVIEVGVGDGRGVGGEEHAIEECVPGGEIQGRIGFVSSLVEEAILVYSLQDLITSAGVVEHSVGVDGDVGCVPGIGIPDSEDDGEGEERPKEGVEGTVEGIDERVNVDSTLIPIQGREGV